MDTVSVNKEVLLSRVAEIVEKLIQGDSFFQGRLDKDEMIQHLVSLFDKFSPEELRAIENDDLIKRIDSILVLEAVAGTLNDLTPEQIEIFEADVEGR
jgi:hypothetical protein